MNHYDALLDALDFDEPIFCAGELPVARLSLGFGDGASLSVADAAFVEKLLARSEPAPFGDGERTRTDARVRAGFRAVERLRVRVDGFDPTMVLDEVSKNLAPDRFVRAELTDVLVYGTEGHFAKHRDTPMDADMLGSLVVCLPVAFEGGELVFDDGGGPVRVEMKTRPKMVRWIAFHGDVEHSVEPVRSGHRVTLTYRLTLGEPREGAKERAAALRTALGSALADPTWVVHGGPRLIPCARRVITERGVKGQEVRLEQLRGADREIAATLQAVGLEPTVRVCIAAAEDERKKGRWLDPCAIVGSATLKPNVTEEGLPTVDKFVTFARRSTSDDADVDAVSLARLIDDGDIEILARPRAQSTLLGEAMFSATGYFGNEYSDAFLYSFVALRVQVPSAEARGVAPKQAPPPEAPSVRVSHTKFGEGVVLREEGSGDLATVVVKFDGAGEKKLLKRFVSLV